MRGSVLKKPLFHRIVCPMTDSNSQKKSEVALREEEILKFWQDNQIFEKSLKKPSPKWP